MLPIPFALVQVASTSLLCAAPRPRNVVCSVPSRLGEHPGEATPSALRGARRVQGVVQWRIVVKDGRIVEVTVIVGVEVVV